MGWLIGPGLGHGAVDIGMRLDLLRCRLAVNERLNLGARGKHFAAAVLDQAVVVVIEPLPGLAEIGLGAGARVDPPDALRVTGKLFRRWIDRQRLARAHERNRGERARGSPSTVRP